MKSRRGFSLIELALVLGISGLMVGFVLQSQQSAATEDCYLATQLELKDINGAIQNFARKNERLPMPAARDVGVEGVTYGREAVAANLDVAGTTTWGALPFQALGLAPSYASDCWGNKLTYVVTTALTTNATSGGYLDSTVVGTITVRKDATTNSSTTAAYAVISHGEDKLGAVKSNYSNTASHGWCTGAASLATQNCLATSATVADATFNNGRDAGTAFFDDVIITSGRPQVLMGSNVVCWGANNVADRNFGALGDGTSTNRSFPSSIASSRNYTGLWSLPQTGYMGVANFCATTADSTTECWGPNASRQLATSDTAARLIPSTIAGYKYSVIGMNGMDNVGNTAQMICGIAAAGGVGIPGNIYCSGKVNGTTLSPPATPQRMFVAANPGLIFTRLYVNGDYNCALTSTDEAYCWGANNFAQLGDGTTSSRTAPTAVSSAGGARRFSKLVLFTSLDWGGTASTCGLTSAADPAGAGKVFCWGSNRYGALGYGSRGGGRGMTSAPTISITGSGGSGATADAIMDAYGGIDGITITNTGSGYTGSPLVTFSGGGVSPVYPSHFIINSNTGTTGTVNTIEAYGVERVPVEVAGGRTYADLVVGSNHMNRGATYCAIESGGDTYCWGDNVYGQTGGGEPNPTGSTLGTACAGRGYTSAPTVNIVGGSGTGATATANISGDCVTNITVTSAGSGYSNTTFAVLSGGGGTGAGPIGLNRVGPVTSANITNAGSGYTTAPTVTFSSGAAAGTAVLSASPVISRVNISTGGSGYTSAPTVTISGGGGTGATATATITAGAVTSVTLTSPGSGYTSTPTVTFTGGGATTDATGTVTFGYTVAGITITNGGSYTVGGLPGITISGGGGSGATANAVVTGPLELRSYILYGLPNGSMVPAPRLVTGGRKFSQLVGIAGWNVTPGFCGITNSADPGPPAGAGRLYCWGAQNSYVLGNNLTGSAIKTTPVLVNNFTKSNTGPATGDTTNLTFTKLIAATNQSPCAITTGNDLYCWGGGVAGVPKAICPGSSGCSYLFSDVRRISSADNQPLSTCAITCLADGSSSNGVALTCCNGDANADGICGP
jgi:alpha-tubulin suppressor-like RCC1 family protein/type II secretory pathway pseudopilin PulG